MKSLIIGAWSIGVYLWTLLFDGGNDIILCWRSKLDILWKSIKINEDTYTLPPSISKVVQDESYDFVFVTCKIYDIIPVLETLKEHNIQAKHRVFIQNWIIPVSLKNEIQTYGDFNSISVFEWYRLVESVLITQQTSVWRKIDDTPSWKIVADILSGVGINCSTIANLDQTRAEKTIMNCSVNVLSAIYEKTFFEIFSDDELLNRTKDIFFETHSVLLKKIELTNVELLRDSFSSFAKPMKHYSSTHQDISTGHRTEIEFLNQLIVELWIEYNIPTPHNDKIMKEFTNMTAE